MRYLVVVDGEHYPPVTRAAVEELAARHEVAGAVLAGGKEKLAKGGLDELGGLRVRTGSDPRQVLYEAVRELGVDAVLDLSDEPVLDYRRRHELAAVALAAGVTYEGADFSFRPPPRPPLAAKPSIAVIGTGKRTGKTAIAGFAARTLAAAGRRPIVVAMGRGGPEDPEVFHGDELEVEARDLLELADSGLHAASDYIEDALLGRVTTVGCRRCGGGLAGAVVTSNAPRGVELANELDGDTMLLEGSGAAIPPVRADVTALIVPSSIPPEYLAGYMGPYRLLISDLVVVTLCEPPFGSPPQVSALTSLIRNAFRPAREGEESPEELRVVRTVFRPQPMRSIEGASVFAATTAPEAAADAIRRHLEQTHGASVVGITHSLSDRERLEKEIDAISDKADTLLCEIKAAAIDVAARRALDEGLDVVFMDNVPVGVDGDDPAEAIAWAAELATARFERSRA